jgi:hypothetical protein
VAFQDWDRQIQLRGLIALQKGDGQVDPTGSGHSMEPQNGASVPDSLRRHRSEEVGENLAAAISPPFADGSRKLAVVGQRDDGDRFPKRVLNVALAYISTERRWQWPGRSGELRLCP